LPGDKMRKLREVMEIYRMALGKGGKAEEEVTERLLAKTILLAKPPNLVSQLT
jgi:hypothetical protein